MASDNPLRSSATEPGQATGADITTEYTYADVSAHASRKDLYVVVHDKVYDVSGFVDEHPYVLYYICSFSISQLFSSAFMVFDLRRSWVRSGVIRLLESHVLSANYYEAIIRVAFVSREGI